MATRATGPRQRLDELQRKLAPPFISEPPTKEERVQVERVLGELGFEPLDAVQRGANQVALWHLRLGRILKKMAP